MIDFDVETTGLQPWSGKQEAFLWIFGDDDGLAEAIPFLPSEWAEYERTGGASGSKMGERTGGDYNIYEAHERIQWWFTRALTEGIRAWNTKFDRAFAVAAECFELPGDGLWHDGMVVAHAIDERRSVALKGVAKALFGEEAGDPQKALKEWLNHENTRRRKVLADADKARVEKLRISYIEEVPCETCFGAGVVAGTEERCEGCAGEGVSATKNKTRKATEEENAAIIAEAESLLDPETGDYHRADFSHVPWPIIHPYALEDVILTRKISDVYDAALDNSPDLRAVVEFERKTMDALFAIEKRGLPARQEEYRKLEQEVIANLDKLEERVHKLAEEGDRATYLKALDYEVDVDETGRIVSYTGGSGDFNPNSTPQIIAALKARGADLSFMSQKDGKLPADAENLRAVDDELAQAILEFRSEYKVLSTYVRPMIGRSYVPAINAYKQPFVAPDSRIHANYRQVGARTGRMSCSDPNMQNQPRDDLRLRYNIVADPGYTLVACDLTNIEMVLFAAYCGEGRLLDAVRKGEDLHVLTAKMLGLRDRKRPGGGVETARQLGKTYNFSRIYGGGLRTIKRSFRCTMDEARLLKRRFDDAYPEVGRLQNRIEFRLADDGYIQDKLISGRRFRVAEREAYKATNYLVQGTAASLLKYAVCKLHEDGIPMVALVHDEIVAHVPVEEAESVAKQIETRMTEFEGLQGVVPLRAEAEIITRWSDAKPLEEKDENDNPTGRKYYFDPEWAGVPRRYIEEAA